MLNKEALCLICEHYNAETCRLPACQFKSGFSVDIQVCENCGSDLNFEKAAESLDGSMVAVLAPCSYCESKKRQEKQNKLKKVESHNHHSLTNSQKKEVQRLINHIMHIYS